MSALIEFLGNRNFWLPKNIEWADLELRGIPTFHDRMSDILLSVCLAACLHAVRNLTRQPILSVAYYFHPPKCWDEKTLTKFSECGWNLICYTSLLLFGITCYVTKPWFMDLRQAAIGMPFHVLESDVRWYFLAALAFNWSRVVGTLQGTRRKDFWLVLVHDVVSLVSVAMGFLGGATRLSLPTMILHDSTDVPLEFGKMANYLQMKKTSMASLIAFTVSWIVARLGIFPFVILRYFIFEAPKDNPLEPPPCVAMAQYLMGAIVLMHLAWTYFIVKTVTRVLQNKTLEDARSSDEENSKETAKME